MKEDFESKIEEFKKILEILPTNNKENRKKKIDYIASEELSNNNMIEKIRKEMDFRASKLDKIPENPDIKKIEEEIEKCSIANEWNIYNTSYEKMHLDYYLYQIHRYYKDDLDSLNDCIRKILESFNKVGISLKKEDFDYNYYVSLYLDRIINNASEEDLAKTFEELYWKFPEIIKTIEVSFKNIYLKYEKKIDKYYESRHNEYLKQHKDSDLDDLKLILSLKLKNLKDKDPYLLFHKILNKEYLIADFNPADIEKKKQAYFKENCYSKNNLSKLNQILFEYNIILRYNYLLQDMKELLTNKDTLKNSKANALKEIDKIEKEVEKLNKVQTPKHSLFKKKKKVDEKWLFNYKENLTKLIDLYNEFDKQSFNDLVYNRLSQDSKILDVLKFISFNYLYFINKTKEHEDGLTIEIISDRYEEFKRNVNSSEFTLLNNVALLDDKPMKEIIVNKCSLDNITLTTEQVDIDNIEKTMKEIDILVQNENIIDSGLLVDDIKFYLEVKKDQG